MCTVDPTQVWRGLCRKEDISFSIFCISKFPLPFLCDLKVKQCDILTKLESGQNQRTTKRRNDTKKRNKRQHLLQYLGISVKKLFLS